MLSTFSIGVHFTSTHAFIVCLEKKLFRIRLKEFVRIDLVENSPIAQRLETIGDYLGEFIQSKKLEDAQINLSFPADLSIVRQLTFPLSVRDDLFSTIKYSLEKYIPIRTEDLHFDFSVISEDKDTKTISVLLGAAKKTDLKPFIDLAASMDAGISCVQIHAAAIANVICNDPELTVKTYPELYVMYADENALDIIFFKNGHYDYSRHIQINGGDVPALMEKEIQAIIKTKSLGSPARPIVFCGPGITHAVYEHFDKDPQVSLKKHGFGKYALPSENFIPAVGLAMNGLVKKMGFQLNLLPAAKRKKVSRSATYFMYTLIFLSIVLGILWGAGHFIQQGVVQKNIDTRLAEFEKELTEINHKKSEIDRLTEEIGAVNRIKMEQVGINEVLNELSRIIPPTSWINSFSFKMDKGIRISGESDTASDLIPLLEASDLFKNAVFLSAITKNSNGKEVFLIGCEIIPEHTVKQQ
jgi:Tfp pilus assembly protein PilN